MNSSLSESDRLIIQNVLIKGLQVDRSQLTDDANIQEDFNPDSLTWVEISLGLEDAFSLDVPDDANEKIKTVSDLYALVADLKASQRQAA